VISFLNSYALQEVCCDAEATAAVLHAFEDCQNPSKDAPSGVPASFSLSFTGTSSAIPCKYRNVSGMYILMPPSAATAFSSPTSVPGGVSVQRQRAIILDPGEGTYGQLCRLFGPSRLVTADPTPLACHSSSLESVDGALLLVRAVWVSHLHADHHLGLVRLLAHRALLVRKLSAAFRSSAAADLLQPVLVIGPTLLSRWLLENTMIDTVLDGQWRFVDAEHFAVMPTTPGAAEKPAFVEEVATEDDCCRGSSNSAADVLTSCAYQISPSKRPRLAEGRLFEQLGVTPDALTSAAGTAISSASYIPVAPMLSSRMRQHGGPRAWRLAPPYSASEFFEPWNSPDSDAPSASQFTVSPRGVDAAMAELGVVQLSVTRVRHCTKAYGLRLACVSIADANPSLPETTVGWSMVYSGDTRPAYELEQLGRGFTDGAPTQACIAPQGLCPCSCAIQPPYSKADVTAPICGMQLMPWVRTLVQSSEFEAALQQARVGCTILIHEATFEDSAGGARNAFEKGHSTVDEACLVATRMGARNTLLTHFSARYPKVPVLKHAPRSVPSAKHSASVPVSISAQRESVGLVCGDTEEEGTCFVAYDLLTVRGDTLRALSRLLPALHAVFKPASSDVTEEVDPGEAAPQESVSIED
jgi:ribonuclease BN (tRNA processing enzyme)